VAGRDQTPKAAQRREGRRRGAAAAVARVAAPAHAPPTSARASVALVAEQQAMDEVGSLARVGPEVKELDEPNERRLLLRQPLL
jgi:hypothetical protein